MWGSWTPAKVKMAVSGCPRNCAEATCKDVGVICVDSGYEIHFAGAAGLDIKGTEVLGHVATEDETHRDDRGARPALSRAGALSRAHLQMGEARRHRHDPRAGRRGRRAAPRALRALRLLAEVRADRSLGRARRKARTRTSSPAWPISPGRRRRNDDAWTKSGSTSARSTTSRAKGRASCARAAGCIAVFRTAGRRRLRARRQLPAQGRAALSQGIVHGHSVTCPLHNWVISLETGEAQGADEGETRTYRLKVEAGRILFDAIALQPASDA